MPDTASVSNKMFRLSRSPSSKTSKCKPIDMTWMALMDKLRTPIRTGETVAEYTRMSKAEKSAAKDVGGFVAGELENGKRSNRTVRYRTMVTLDADKAYPYQWDDLILMYDGAVAMYSTHSHTPDTPRFRFLFPLSRPVTPDEYGAIARKLAQIVGINTMDRTTYEPARLMYWPSCPSDGEYRFECQDGAAVDADAVLAEYGPGDAWTDTSLWPTSNEEEDIVDREIKELGDPRQKPGLVGAFCRAYTIEEAIAEFIPDVYEKCDTHSREPRYTFRGGSTYGGVSIYNNGLLLYSRHDTDPAGGGLHCQNAFDLVRIHKFGSLDRGKEQQEPTRKPSYKAMCDFVQSLDGIKRMMAQERLASVAADFADMADSSDDITPDGVSSSSGGNDNGDSDDGNSTTPTAPDDDSWMTELTYQPKTDNLEATASNVLLILRNDPILKGRFGFNELLERVVITKPLPWHDKVFDTRDGDPWIDSDSANLRVYLEKVWGLKNRADIKDAFDVVQDENRFNALREYLDSLKWDGVERLDTLLIRYLAADDTDYVRAVTRKWFTAAVARVYHPGQKFDSMLVLVGDQGIGKSTLCQIMARGRFTDSLDDLKGKSAYEQLRGVWIAEIAELSSFKRSDVETVKKFISKTEDSYRPAYGEFTRTFKRQCVFFGTTNDAEFLRDRTGNRRFWPVQLHNSGRNIDEEGVLVGLADEIDQLWAEAVVRYRDGEVLWLNNRSLQAEALKEQERFTVQDELVGQIEEYLETRLPDNWEKLSVDDRREYIQGRSPLDLGPCNLRRDVVSIIEIRCEMCGEDKAKNGGNDLLSRRIANLMNTMPGWEKQPKRRWLGAYGQQWVYRREEADPDTDSMYSVDTDAMDEDDVLA